MPSKTKKILALVLVLAALAVVLFLLLRPRTFPQTMGRDYDPDRLREISVYLTQTESGQSREITLSPEDPAAEELLALLNSWTYSPVYHFGVNTGHSIALDYYGSVFLIFEKQEDGYPAGAFYFDGYPEIQTSGTGGHRGSYRLSKDQQQQLLDLLLAQPYTEE